MLAAGAARLYDSEPPLVRARSINWRPRTPRTPRTTREGGGTPAEAHAGPRQVIAPTAVRDLGDQQHRRARPGAGRDSRHEGWKIISDNAARHEAELEEQARRRSAEISAGEAAALPTPRSPRCSAPAGSTTTSTPPPTTSGPQPSMGAAAAARAARGPAMLTTAPPAATAASTPTPVPVVPVQTTATRTSPPGRLGRPLARWVECSHTLSGLPCMNHHPHAGDGCGCVHYSTSGVPDRHDYGDQ